MRAGTTHDLPGDAFRLLSDQVAYLKLSAVKAAQAASYVERSKSNRGLIIDLRNYPSEFVPFALGRCLSTSPRPLRDSRLPISTTLARSSGVDRP